MKTYLNMFNAKRMVLSLAFISMSILAYGQGEVGSLSEKQYEKGRSYQEKGNYKKAVEWYTKAADNGHSYSQHLLYKTYLWGKPGVARDLQKSFKYCYIVAQNGNPEDQWELGKMYMYGTGTRKDNDLAILWLTRSAKQNYKYAAYMLGRLYSNLGDTDKAEYWFSVEKQLKEGIVVFKKE